MGIKGALGKIFYSRPLTYGYSSARVRARKNLILKKSFYEDLLNQRTMDSIIAMLERTYYRSVLTEGILLEYFTPEDGSKFVEMGAELHTFLWMQLCVSYRNHWRVNHPPLIIPTFIVRASLKQMRTRILEVTRLATMIGDPNHRWMLLFGIVVLGIQDTILHRGGI